MFCNSKSTKKYGKVKQVQRYFCYACKRQFLANKRLNSTLLWQEYTQGKQTYIQLAKRYDCSSKTIQRHIDLAKPRRTVFTGTHAVIIMDTTYFGRNFGVMAFKDWLSKQVVYKCYVAYETNQAYVDGITHIQSLGIAVQAIVCDGRRGLLQRFKDLPAQMCHFHQVQIINRYLTRKPKAEAAQMLRMIALRLKDYDEEMLLLVLAAWFEVYQTYINERSISPSTGKSQYSHRRLRSAYHSLKRNAKYLYTYKQYSKLNIPNTTNALDGLFSNLKKQLNNHQGLSLSRKQKFIDDFFKC